MEQKLIELLGALNAIEVYGKKNVGTLFNCITFVEGMIAECKQPPAEKVEAKEETTK